MVDTYRNSGTENFNCHEKRAENELMEKMEVSCRVFFSWMVEKIVNQSSRKESLFKDLT